MDSSVPQGKVLGPLLFLLFINDIPNNLSACTTIRLFADDCFVYRPIRSMKDQILLQKELTTPENWSITWGMSFNPSKCNILRTRPESKTLLQHFYTLHGQILKEVNTAKYLGVLLSNDLFWSPHMDNTARRANQKLGFICRNLRGSPITYKCLAYTSLAVGWNMLHLYGTQSPKVIFFWVTFANLKRSSAKMPDGLNHVLNYYMNTNKALGVKFPLRRHSSMLQNISSMGSTQEN